MNFVFLMDPLETVRIEKDTTFILMVGAHRRGHQTFYLLDNGISIRNGKIFFDVTEVIAQSNQKLPFIRKSPMTLSENQVHAVFVRNDPPFDERYLMNTWLLNQLPQRIPIINNPSGIRTVNEKIWASQFTTITPPTVISGQKKCLLEFLRCEKDVIAKPTNGFGGSSIFHIKPSDDNTNVILETLTRQWTQEIILQKYISAAKTGDKRILLLNGEPLGAVLRVHVRGDHRNNFFAGGRPRATTITAHDQCIIEILRPELKKLGLTFVGIDIIGEYLIEVNVTSPTCLQEMNRLNHVHLEEKVIMFVESLVPEKSETKICKQ